MKKYFESLGIEIHAFLSFLLMFVFSLTPIVSQVSPQASTHINLFLTEINVLETKIWFLCSFAVGFIALVLMFIFNKNNKLPQLIAYSIFILMYTILFVLMSFSVGELMASSSGLFKIVFGFGWYASLVMLIYSIVLVVNFWTENCTYFCQSKIYRFIK